MKQSTLPIVLATQVVHLLLVQADLSHITLDTLVPYERKVAENQQFPNCMPLLPTYLNGSAQPLDNQDHATGQLPLNAETLAGHLANLSFAVGDIDMPITFAESSMQSAMRLWSALGNQFDDEPLDETANAHENIVQFRENHLKIQGLNLSMLNVHLFPSSEPKFSIGLQIKNTSMSGRFSYKGPMHLSSNYRLSIDDIFLVGSANLTQRTPFREQLGHWYDQALKTSNLTMNITNMGYISLEILDSNDQPTTNYLLKMLQRVLQKSIKRIYFTFENHIRNALERESRHTIDCELSRFSDLRREQWDIGSANSQDLAEIIRIEMLRSNMDTVSLPIFEHQQVILGTSAKIEFYNGSLSGLANVVMNGETRIKLQDDHLYVNASIGWQSLKPYYNWELTVGGSKTSLSKGFVAFDIQSVILEAIITKGVQPKEGFVVEKLTIHKLENPKMDIGGLPGMNRITRGMVNFFMGRLKQRMASSIQPVLQQQLEKTLNRIINVKPDQPIDPVQIIQLMPIQIVQHKPLHFIQTPIRVVSNP